MLQVLSVHSFWWLDNEFKQLHSPYQFCLPSPLKVLLNITQIRKTHYFICSNHIQVKWKVKNNHGRQLSEVKQWRAACLYAAVMASAQHQQLWLLWKQNTKNATKCNRSKTLWFCSREALLFPFFKCMFKKTKRLTLDHRCEQKKKTPLFNYNQKAIYDYLLQKFFSRQLKQQPLTYGISLTTSL